MTDAYKYYERYYIDFTSVPNGDGEVFTYHVSLQQRLVIPSYAPVPTPVELDGGRSPFVVSLQNEANPLMPMRSASARISFVDDIDLGELLPADAFEWRVELTRTTDGVKIFVGYLTAEVYTQPASGGVNVVTVNAASPMVPIAATAMPIEDKGALTIGELIRMAIETSDDIQTVYIPAIYSLKNNASAADYADLLRWRFSTGNFLRFTDEAVSGKNVECDTYQVALEAVCKLFGWSMVDCGDGCLYFISPAYQGPYMRVARTQLDGGRFTPELVTPSAFDSLAIIPIDKADTVDYQQGAGSASVSASIKKIALEMPNIEASVKEQRFSRKGTTARSSSGDGVNYKDYSAECAMIEAILSNPRLKMPKYYLTTDSNNQPIWNSISTEEEALERQGSVGAFYRKIDWCNPEVLNLASENPKRGWALESAIMFRDAATYYVGSVLQDVRFPNSWALMEIDFGQVLLPKGAIVIDFSVMASTIEGFYLVNDGVYKGGDIEDSANNLTSKGVGTTLDWWGAGKAIRMSISVGEKYYSNDGWINSFAILDVPVSSVEDIWHPTDSNKTVDMLYEGDSGYYIPVDTFISGNMKVCIYPCFYPTDGPSANRGLIPDAYIKGLSITFANLIEHKITSEADASYYKDFGNNYTEKKEISLPLHSRVDAAEQMSLIYDSQGEVIDTIHRTTSTTAEKPERFLLDEYERIFGRTQRRWRRGLWLRELRPLDIFTLPAVTDSALMLTGYTMDFEENTAEAYLLDVKTKNLVKYVE